MKIPVKANKIKVGDVLDGKIVQIVDVGNNSTILHFGLRQTKLPLMNTADVLVERKMGKTIRKVDMVLK